MQTAIQIYQHQAQTPEIINPQAQNDKQVLNLWLFGKAEKTVKEYRRDIDSFMDFTGNKPLRFVTLADVQGYLACLSKYAPRTQGRKLAAIKSLLSFSQKIGWTPFNPGAAVKAPKVKNDLAQRIMSEEECLAQIRMETNPRNQALLRFLYTSGCRASEASRLSWHDFSQNPDGTAVVTVMGKGGKTRHVLLPAGTWTALAALRRPEDTDADPVFRSRKGNHLSPVQIWRICRAAAQRAGITKSVSPHWWRHALASHALARGANIAVVSSTLGHSSLAVTSVYVHVKPSDSAGLYLAVG